MNTYKYSNKKLKSTGKYNGPDENTLFDPTGSPIIGNSRQSAICPDSQISGISMSSQEDSQFGMSSPKSDPTALASPMNRDIRADHEQLQLQQTQIDGWIKGLTAIKKAAKKNNADKYNFARTIIRNLNNHELHFNDKAEMVADFIKPVEYSDSDSQGTPTEDGSGQKAVNQEEEEVEEEVEEEKDTPAEVLEVKGQLNQIYKDLTEAEDKEEAKRLAKEHVEQTMSTFELALQDNKDINDEDILSIIDDSKIKTTCKSGSSECSALSILTADILKLETVKILQGNKTVETGQRHSNVDNIMNAILSSNIKKQTHLSDGEKTKLRDDGERNTETDKQFENVWGIGLNAKDLCCYLCQGNLVNELQVVPEMEHKLPSIEFFTKVPNINEKYPGLSQEWQTYVQANVQLVRNLYWFINCNPNSWKNDPVRFINAQFKIVLDPFFQLHSTDPEINQFIALLKVYLMEYAYSHHLCNQIKDNDNLKTAKIRDTYIKRINACKERVKSGKNPGEPRVKINKVDKEKDYINFNADSNKIIGSHLQVINTFINDYANEVDTSTRSSSLKLKTIMIQSIKSTLNYMIDKQNVKKQKKHAVKSANTAAQKYIPILDSLDTLKIKYDEYIDATNKGGRKLSIFKNKNESYDADAYADELREHNESLNNLEIEIKRGNFTDLKPRLSNHISLKAGGRGGKKRTRKQRKSKKKSVRRCNKTQRHRKTKKK